jgi:hypothetical protein
LRSSTVFAGACMMLRTYPIFAVPPSLSTEKVKMWD